MPWLIWKLINQCDQIIRPFGTLFGPHLYCQTHVFGMPKNGILCSYDLSHRKERFDLSILWIEISTYVRQTVKTRTKSTHLSVAASVFLIRALLLLRSKTNLGKPTQVDSIPKLIMPALVLECLTVKCHSNRTFYFQNVLFQCHTMSKNSFKMLYNQTVFLSKYYNIKCSTIIIPQYQMLYYQNTIVSNALLS